MGFDDSLDERVADFEKRAKAVKPSRSEALATAIESLQADAAREKLVLDSGGYRMESQRLAAKERIAHLDGCVAVLGEISEE